MRCSGVNLMTRMLVTFPWLRESLFLFRLVNGTRKEEVHTRIRIR